MSFADAGNTALHFAVEASDRESIARLLIANGANLDVVNKKRQTPLEVAIDKGIPFKCE